MRPFTYPIQPHSLHSKASRITLYYRTIDNIRPPINTLSASLLNTLQSLYKLDSILSTLLMIKAMLSIQLIVEYLLFSTLNTITQSFSIHSFLYQYPFSLSIYPCGFLKYPIVLSTLTFHYQAFLTPFVVFSHLIYKFLSYSLSITP